MDHMEIGSGILQMIISKLIRGLVSNVIKKQADIKVIFQSPLVFDNDGSKVVLKLNTNIEMSTNDFKNLITTLM